ncbi:IS66 family insertion sequence element accessory protein TnpB [Allorhizobium sp. NPDC080224]
MIEAVPDRLDGSPRQLRRFWSDEFKATAVEQACQPGVNMSAIARQIGILPSQLYRWRRELLASEEPGQPAPAVERQSAATWPRLRRRNRHWRYRRAGRPTCRRSASAARDPGGSLSMIPAGVKVFLASHPIDFRKGPDSLLSLVRDAGSDPFNGSLYVFRAKRADRVKIVWWDGSGVCLYSKRLEKAQFCWPRIGHNRVQLNHAQLMALVDGMDWKRVRSVAVKPPEIVG